MGLLDRDLAFCYDYIRRLQEKGIQTMEFAQENSQRQEESMQRLRECIADLPPEVDTRALERSLDEHQGTMISPLFEETKHYFRHRLDSLLENLVQIDREAMESFMDLIEQSRQLEWQYRGLVHMVGAGSKSLNAAEFQAKLNQVMTAGEDETLRSLLSVEDGSFTYQWEAIGRLLQQETLSEAQQKALYHVLGLALEETEGQAALYEQWMAVVKQAMTEMEPGSHTHIGELLRQFEQLANDQIITAAAYAELEAQYLWYQASKQEQEQMILAEWLAENKETFMKVYGLSEEDYEERRANFMIVSELWWTYEDQVTAYQKLSRDERLARSELVSRHPGADFLFLSQLSGFSADQRLDFLSEMQANGGILSDAAYERIVGQADSRGYAMAWIQITYNTSATDSTFDDLLREVSQEKMAQRLQLVSGVLMDITIARGANANNPLPYDGNLDPNNRLDRMEMNSKNYEYVIVSPKRVPKAGDADFIGPPQSEGVGKAKVPMKENGGYNSQAESLGDHGSKHAYNPDNISTKNKSQYGKNVDIKELVNDTMNKPDSVDTKYDSDGIPWTKVYKKSYDGNISTSDTPTGEHRVFENLIEPDKSSNFPLVPRK